MQNKKTRRDVYAAHGSSVAQRVAMTTAVGLDLLERGLDGHGILAMKDGVWASR
ncbi:MAG: hypothetical protein M3Y57_03910 [Acidobacteriota bacterium]|nr:hypothetical protein [Acidobacteriota bacterium]